MRKTLAAVALAGAALGFTAPSASADGCYGVQRTATVCYSGEFGTTPGGWTYCVYTGSTTCEPYTVPVPDVVTPYGYEVCVGKICQNV